LIERDGILIEEPTPSGMRLRKNPALVVWKEALQQMRMWAVEFGMTPASRGRIRIRQAEQRDELEEFLNRGIAPGDSS
jgi:P27 family predicted phage terminase small subunit